MYRNPKSRIPTFEMAEYYQSQPDTGPHTAWTSKAVSWNFPMFSNCGEKNMQGLTKATCHTRSNCPFRKSQAKRVRLRQVREVSLLLLHFVSFYWGKRYNSRMWRNPNLLDSHSPRQLRNIAYRN
ncbi:uncharacterized protein PADG_11796 [Paracoccidioides brasiliensis Pb18]|uniref:Uncharacterized protein n=1 Tax=Paracoccidioides brasiliensis (strain Pb18) TaxID=502780 RepID=A0A0A0HS07_PARBD|nr:uncharacterized protein PADG_11796 [Paracoccidioides brasiliensis Pb18]KGM92009.1 hypothetical protein PADG_11796 [Paracoccidioides brasiliensis Pb18]